MVKTIFKSLAIFILGISGGIFADQILWPYIIERPLFYQYRLEQQPIYITENKEIKVQENAVLQDMAEKASSSIIAVKSAKTIIGSSLVVTRDGLAVTLNSSVPKTGGFSFVSGEKTISYQVLKRDVQNNLALVKLEGSEFNAVAFSSGLKFGEKLFSLGFKTQKTEPKRIISEGIVSYIDNQDVQTAISEKDAVPGSVVFNIKGEAVGILGLKGKIILADKIRDLAGI